MVELTISKNNMLKRYLPKRGENMAYKCGEKPGIGRYICTKCGEDLHLDDSDDRLPPCSKCRNCTFTKR